MNFNENFYKLRKQKGLTQEELAEKLQVSRQSISKWENGEVIPDIIKVGKIAEILEVSIDSLCGLETTQKIETNQNIKAEQDITLKVKSNPIYTIIIAVIVAIVFGISGYYFGHSTATYQLPDNINVSNLNFSLTHSALTCKFVPEIYFDELSYTVILINESTDNRKSCEAIYENGIGTATITADGTGYFQVILQISSEQESRNIVLADRLYINLSDGTITAH